MEDDVKEIASMVTIAYLIGNLMVAEIQPNAVSFILNLHEWYNMRNFEESNLTSFSYMKQIYN